MIDTAIITFNFNEYDRPRTHYLSNHIKHIHISDKPLIIPKWECITFNKFHDNPWANSLYVRYHPFEFTDNEYVIVIDGSLSITSGIDELTNTFIESGCDIGVLLSHQAELTGRISRWISNQRIDGKELSVLSNMMRSGKCWDYKGTIASCFKIFHKSDDVQKYLDACWYIISSNDMIRLDEVPATLELEKFTNLTLMPFSTNLIQGDAFVYHHHNSNTIYKLQFNKTEFWLKNQPVKPVHIGLSYRREYLHKSEAMCLTRFFTENELRFWLDYHLTLGFDHIHIFDNESSFSCKSICDEYGDRVSYEFISGNARHYKIFDDYVNSDRCKSEWIMPIDDDEFLTLNPDICTNVNELIDWYLARFPNSQMFAIRWKHLFPKKFHTECTGNILEYCTEENSVLARAFQPMGDLGIKTFVRRCGYVHYEETEENPHGGHVPSHRLANGARFYTGDIISRCSCRSFPTLPGEPARLIHCRYKGYTWYKQKMANIITNQLCLDNTSGIIYTKRYKFDSMLEDLD